MTTCRGMVVPPTTTRSCGPTYCGISYTGISYTTLADLPRSRANHLPPAKSQLPSFGGHGASLSLDTMWAAACITIARHSVVRGV